MNATEQFETSSKKGRGMARQSLDLIEKMHAIAEAAQPITGRGIGYKLFVAKLIASMGTGDMQKVYRLLKLAREQGKVSWKWIVDETRELEGRVGWEDPAAFVLTVSRAYRRDFWLQQPRRVQVWSEKGTVRGVLSPVLDRFGVQFRYVHGFSSATAVHDTAEDFDGRTLIILYVGDYDPSGMYMSEEDLPRRFENYGGDHVILKRIALLPRHLRGLPSFPASEKKKDTRHPWFVRNYGKRCWELDALDPNDLRDLVEKAIQREIEWKAWNRCAVVERAERVSLRTVLDSWKGVR
jgi:hypothetical protein